MSRQPIPLEPCPNDAVRFWAKVNKTDTCWLWTAHRDLHGYGRFGLHSNARGHQMVNAHRISWVLSRGPIPDGLVLDHLCRVPACVNPAHLEPVTHAENCRRGVAGQVNAARLAGITHCPAGHLYDEQNTCLKIGGSGYLCRSCRACARDYSRARRERFRSQASRP